MAEIIYPNGESLPFEPKDGKEFSLKELQDAVGGLIEVVSLSNGKLMIINEEGKFKNLESNHVATELFTPESRIFPDHIVGNAIVMEREEME